MTQDELQDIRDNRDVVKLIARYAGEVIDRKTMSMGTANETDLILIRRSIDGMRELKRAIEELGKPNGSKV